MLQTPLSAELQLPAFLGEGFKHWRAAIHHNLPWLLVTVTFDDGCGFGDCSEQWMVDNPETLEQLIDEFGEDRKVDYVQVATPPWMNHLGRWLVEPVQALMIGMHEQGHGVHIYQLPCGRTYYWGLRDEGEKEQISTKRVIFSKLHEAADGLH
ncbi:hypothetical protein ACP0I7_27605 [Pseudomonas aeruginosa]